MTAPIPHRATVERPRLEGDDEVEERLRVGRVPARSGTDGRDDNGKRRESRDGKASVAVERRPRSTRTPECPAGQHGAQQDGRLVRCDEHGARPERKRDLAPSAVARGSQSTVATTTVSGAARTIGLIPANHETPQQSAATSVTVAQTSRAPRVTTIATDHRSAGTTSWPIPKSNVRACVSVTPRMRGDDNRAMANPCGEQSRVRPVDVTRVEDADELERAVGGERERLGGHRDRCADKQRTCAATALRGIASLCIERSIRPEWLVPVGRLPERRGRRRR